MHNPGKKKCLTSATCGKMLLVPDITNMSFFKSTSFKSGEKDNEIYNKREKKQIIE